MTRQKERDVIIGLIVGKIINANGNFIKAKNNRDRMKYSAIAHEMHLLRNSIEALYNIKPLKR